MKARQYKIYIVASADEEIGHVVDRIMQLDFNIVLERVLVADCMSLLRDTIPDAIIVEEKNSVENFLMEIGSKYRNLPIIVLSDSDSYSKGLQMIEEGAEDYICQDQIERLDVAIARILKKSSYSSKTDIRSGLYSLEEEILGMCYDEQIY